MFVLLLVYGRVTNGQTFCEYIYNSIACVHKYICEYCVSNIRAMTIYKLSIIYVQLFIPQFTTKSFTLHITFCSNCNVFHSFT